MFDVSFSELMVIAVVALIVIGPEKLPKVARTVGALAGRMQRYVAQIKEEVNREVRFQELQQLQQEIQDNVNKAKDSIQSGLQTSVDLMNQEVAKVELEAKAFAATEASTQPEEVVVKKTTAKRPQTKKVVQSPQANQLDLIQAEAENIPTQKSAVRKPSAKKTSTNKIPTEV